MGLFGFLIIPMTCGVCELVLSDPTRFLRSPASWMGDVGRFGATGTAGPNFAYKLAARSLETQSSASLSTLRFVLCGGERISRDAIETFLTAAQPMGLSRSAMVGAYGLAEATLAVTMTDIGRGLFFETAGVDGVDREFADLGHPIPGIEVKIANGERFATRAANEVLVRGKAVSLGASSPDGWLHTGDSGFLSGGRLRISGRRKELIIRGGRNYYPEDFESTLNAVTGVKPGAALVTSRPSESGTEEILAFVEAALAESELTDLRKRINTALLAEHGMSAKVVFVGARTLPKTPSGKFQRAKAVNMFL
jgi:fatty-acyl-CoA synthase